MLQRIEKAELVRRLERSIGTAVGISGLNVLIHGWLKYRKYGNKYRDKLYHREWMYITEVIDFSEYAQYDLTKI